MRDQRVSSDYATHQQTVGLLHRKNWFTMKNVSTVIVVWNNMYCSSVKARFSGLL